MSADEPIEAAAGPPNFKLLLPFDTDDPEFVRGFEAGRIYTIAQGAMDEDGNVDDEPMLIHASNTEMAMRIAEALGMRVQATPYTDDTWAEIVFQERDDD